MKKLTLHLLMLLFATQAATICAQTREKPAPQFTLTIEPYYHEFGPIFNRVAVKMTNISDGVITEPGCAASRGLYILSILYNGNPLDEKDAAARHLREAKQVQFCTQELGINKIKPGESVDHWIGISSIFDVSRPGTYEITVSRETDPKPDASRPGTYLERASADPDRSVTVKSNTLTVVVPESSADALK